MIIVAILLGDIGECLIMSNLVPTFVVSKLDHIDYWSAVKDKILILPGEEEEDIVLPTIFIEWLPRAAQEVFDILIFKYSAKKDLSGSDNKITGGTITARAAPVVVGIDAIAFVDGEATVAADTKEGGDVHVGHINICGYEVDSGIISECVVIPEFKDVTTAEEGLELYDVQVGIRIYFV